MSTPLSTAEAGLYRSSRQYITPQPHDAAGFVIPIARAASWLDECIEICQASAGEPDVPPDLAPSSPWQCRQWCLDQGPPKPPHPSCQRANAKGCIWPLSYGKVPTECCPTTHTCCMWDNGYRTLLNCCPPDYPCCNGICCLPGQECCPFATTVGKCYWPAEHRCSHDGLCPVGHTICEGKCCSAGEVCTDGRCTPPGQVWCQGWHCSGRCIPKVGDPSGTPVCCPPGRDTEAGCCPDHLPMCGGKCCREDEACGRGTCCKKGICCENAPCKPGFKCCDGQQCCPNHRICGPRDPVTGDIRCLRP
jgi:hypothetical protein